MPKLTKTIVDKTQPSTRDVWVWDSELPGFGIRVQPSGRKTYVTRYRTATGKQRKQTIARCADMPPDKARDLARKVFSAVAEGKDPVADRQNLRNAPTMEQMRDRYMKEHAIPYKKPSSADEDKRNWRRHILPRFAGKKVIDVTKADVVAMHAAMAHIPSAANACIALLSKAMNLAEDWGWRPQNSNPCRRLKKYKIPEKETILTVKQIADLDRALDEMVHERAIPYPMACLTRLWLITGCRNSEIRKAKRAWVDFERQLLVLPDSKVGERKISLPDVAIDIIKTLPEGEWLIPGRKAGEHLKSPWGMFHRICERAGIPPGTRPHDLRHTVGSLGHHHGLSQRQIAQQLGHRQLSTTERYIHGVNTEEAKAADRIAQTITKGWSTASAAASGEAA